MALVFSTHLPVSVCGTDAEPIHVPFLASQPVSYTHLDVYKRQELHPSGQNLVELAPLSLLDDKIGVHKTAAQQLCKNHSYSALAATRHSN